MLTLLADAELHRETYTIFDSEDDTLCVKHFPELNGSMTALSSRPSGGFTKRECECYGAWRKEYEKKSAKDRYLESVKRWQEFIIDGIRIQGFERFLSDDVFRAIHEEINRVVYTYCR